MLLNGWRPQVNALVTIVAGNHFVAGTSSAAAFLADLAQLQRGLPTLQSVLLWYVHFAILQNLAHQPTLLEQLRSPGEDGPGPASPWGCRTSPFQEKLRRLARCGRFRSICARLLRGRLSKTSRWTPTSVFHRRWMGTSLSSRGVSHRFMRVEQQGCQPVPSRWSAAWCVGACCSRILRA